MRHCHRKEPECNSYVNLMFESLRHLHWLLPIQILCFSYCYHPKGLDTLLLNQINTSSCNDHVAKLFCTLITLLGIYVFSSFNCIAGIFLSTPLISTIISVFPLQVNALEPIVQYTRASNSAAAVLSACPQAPTLPSDV